MNKPVGIGNGSQCQEDDKVQHSGDTGFFYLDTAFFLVAFLLALHTYQFSRDYGLRPSRQCQSGYSRTSIRLRYGCSPDSISSKCHRRRGPRGYLSNRTANG